MEFAAGKESGMSAFRDEGSLAARRVRETKEKVLNGTRSPGKAKFAEDLTEMLFKATSRSPVTWPLDSVRTLRLVCEDAIKGIYWLAVLQLGRPIEENRRIRIIIGGKNDFDTEADKAWDFVQKSSLF